MMSRWSARRSVVLVGALMTAACSSGSGPTGDPATAAGRGGDDEGSENADNDDGPLGGRDGSSSETGGGAAGATAGESGGGGNGGEGGEQDPDEPADGGGMATPEEVITPTPPDAELATASGCAGVYNPDQLLTLSFTIDAGDFSRVLADTTYAVVVPAQMQCQDEPPLTVGVRRKRSGGQTKVGFKIDINEIVAGQRWYGLKKLSLENGVSEGDTEDGAEVRTYVAEYLAWRLMMLSGAVASRAALVSVQVNGDPLGVYVNVEQVDKRFLQERLGDDSGWLYKKSGGVNDGLKTNELGGGDNPYDDYFCFWASGNGCALPSSAELAAELPAHLDIPQFLRFGAVNAIMANTDGPLFKDNNYYYYDYATGPRAYIPWDLDTAMKDSPSLYSGGGGGGGTSDFDAVLFTHWRDDYTAILQELLDTRLTDAVIEAELDRVLLLAEDAFAADPYVTGTTSDAVAGLKAYWSQRLVDAQAELP
jgi:hypothetical protein